MPAAMILWSFYPTRKLAEITGNPALPKTFPGVWQISYRYI